MALCQETADRNTHTHPVYYKHKHGVRFAIVLTVVKLQIASELFRHPQIIAA